MTELERTELCECAAVAVEGGLGAAAVAAISAVPAVPLREYEIARWARRIAAESSCSAFVVPEDFTDETAVIIAELIVRVQLEIGGRS